VGSFCGVWLKDGMPLIAVIAIQGSLSAFSLAHTEGPFPFWFLVYAALLRNRLLKSQH
jgi:hypothetical protein